MATHIEQVDLPYTQRQVFDLVADIEAYAQFLPSVISARIKSRAGNTLFVDQLVRFTVLPMPIATRAVLDAPNSIQIACSDNPVVTFTELWTFAPRGDGGTHLSSRTEYTFRSNMLRRALDSRFNALQGATMRAFAARARALYGAAPPGMPPLAPLARA
jgi:coenzyme Q-binding protein COQ10